MCFSGVILSGLEIRNKSEKFPQHVEGLIERYGEPDLVIWGQNEKSRIMVWGDEGFMANIENEIEGDSSGLSAWPFFLFPPIIASELDDSWIIQYAPFSPTKEALANMPLPWRVEDPWGYNDD